LEEKTKRIIVVGIPGVGKTTVVSSVKNTLEQTGITTCLAEFGKIMLEEAEKMNIKSRDEIRRISIDEQKNYRILLPKEFPKCILMW
jgi:adenylate kinase